MHLLLRMGTEILERNNNGDNFLDNVEIIYVYGSRVAVG